MQLYKGYLEIEKVSETENLYKKTTYTFSKANKYVKTAIYLGKI